MYKRQVPGGGGKLLNLSFPVLQGTFESGGSQLNLDGCTAVFQVMLNFSDRITSQWKNAENNILDLTFDFSVPRYLPEEGKTRSFTERDSGGIVTPLDLIGCSSVLRALILNLLTDFLISQRETFQKIIFANVILKGKQGNWLSPVLCRYSFLDGPVPYMAVLAVCSDRDISNLQLDVDVSGADLTTGLSYYAVSKLSLIHILFISLCVVYFYEGGNGNERFLFSELLCEGHKIYRGISLFIVL